MFLRTEQSLVLTKAMTMIQPPSLSVPSFARERNSRGSGVKEIPTFSGPAVERNAPHLAKPGNGIARHAPN